MSAPQSFFTVKVGEVPAANQPTHDDLAKVANEGYKSVINVRAPGEAGFLSDEEKRVKDLGMEYAHVPVEVCVSCVTGVVTCLYIFCVVF